MVRKGTVNQMTVFVYRAKVKKNEPGVIVFKCKAESITEADKLYEAAIGKGPAKQAHIECSFTGAPGFSED
jgi:hypothetical protein